MAKQTLETRVSDLEADLDDQVAENERLKERQILAAQVLSGDLEIELEEEEDNDDDGGEPE